MYNAPPPDLIKGIGLVQAGRKADALPYLRQAAQLETRNPEGWLWLAAATDDLDEYRHCVYQALRLDPYHPVAGRMRRALEALDTAARLPQPTPAPMSPVSRSGTYDRPMGTGGAAAPVREAYERRARWSWLRRIVRAVVLALLIGGCLGVSAALIQSGEPANLVRDWLRIEELHTLDFTVGETPGYHFRVDVPESWRPANEDNPSWRSLRSDLEAAFLQSVALWETLDEPFSVVVRDPAYGRIMPPVHLVETDTARITSQGMVTTLTLHEIVPLPEPPADQPDTVCGRMRTLETQFAASGGFSAVVSGSQVLDTSLVVRDDPDDCVSTVGRRYTDQRPDQVPSAISAGSAPSATREVVIAVPVGGTHYAVWRMVYADSAHATYESVVSRVIATLEYVP